MFIELAFNPAAKNWYIQQIGWYVLAALALWGIIYLIWAITRKWLSLLMPMREQKVEVLKITGTGLEALDGQNYMPSKAKVTVVFQKNKKRKKKTLFANHVGAQEGDKGILRYRGVYCVEFDKQGSVHQDEIDLYYHFGFDKNKQQEVVQKERKKRKYW